MMPQSVWYDNTQLIAKDAAVFAAHKDLHLCARDRWSYDFMKKHFPSTHIYLVPDLAFYINDSKLAKWRGLNIGKKLFLLRTDKELSPDTPSTTNFTEFEIRNWPTMEKDPWHLYYIRGICSVSKRKLSKCPWLLSIIERSMDYCADILIRRYETNIGLKFLSQYDTIVSTRLHGLILGVLLHKDVSYIDNTSKKLSAFVSTWLSDLPAVTPYNPSTS